ncbi:MAG TPA: hypothetical protein VFF73_00685 [Planctomycetota bacterium]|nr:hypothetical protein [Planctomycetota bacterium]
MIIEFDESTPLHTIKELAPGLRVEERAVELSIPDLEKAAKVEFAVDFHGAPVTFVKMSYNEVPLDPQRTGHGQFVFDPKEFGHTLKIEFDTKAIPAPKQKEAPQWEGQINFRVEGDDKWSAFFIQVEKFLGDEQFDGVFAVDLGTTNSCVAFWEVKPEPNFLPTAPTLLGEGQSVASGVNVLELEPFKTLVPESYDIGQAAVGSPRKTNLHFSVKRGIGTKRKYVLTEGTEIWNADAQHMYTAVAKKLLGEGRAAIGKGITEIVVTSPPRWNAIQMMECRNTWRSLGFSPDRIDMSTDEATGCAFYYVLYPLFQRFGKKSALRDYVETEFGPMKVGDGQFEVNLLAMDIGGGTSDLALVKCHLQFEPQHLSLDIDVVDRGGRQDLGGDNVTLYLFDILKRRMALALAAPNRLIDPNDKNPPPSNPWIKHFKLDPQQAAILQNWDRIQKVINSPEPLPRDIWDLLNGILPTAWDWKGMPPTYRKFKPVARKNFDYIWLQADQIKRALCVEVAQQMAGKRNLSEAELKAFESKWLAPDLEDFQGDVSLADSLPMAQEDEEFKKKFLSLTYGDICNFIRPSVQGLCEESRRMEQRSLAPGKKIDRIVLAGNGARIPIIGPIIAAPRDKGGLGISPDQIKFDPGTAKLAVPIGACLRRIARKVEGFKININMSRSLLPFELYTNLGTRSVKMFDVGQIDEFRFYMRKGVSEDLEVEFVTRLEESDVGTENYKPYVLFKTNQEGLPLIDLSKEDDLWESLEQSYGLDAIPRLKDIFQGPFSAYDSKKPEDSKAGINVIKASAPTKEFKKVGDHTFTMEDMHLILNNDMRLPQKIAWIEQGFSEPLPEGEIVHRYYLDVTKQLFLVRHHWKDGKVLFAAETDEKALEELPPERNPFSGMH